MQLSKDFSFYQPHQQRMIEEFKELDDRTTKLRNFLEHRNYQDIIIDQEERSLQLQQYHAMSDYRSVLAKRINKFNI